MFKEQEDSCYFQVTMKNHSIVVALGVLVNLLWTLFIVDIKKNIYCVFKIKEIQNFDKNMLH